MGYEINYLINCFLIDLFVNYKDDYNKKWGNKKWQSGGNQDSLKDKKWSDKGLDKKDLIWNKKQGDNKGMKWNQWYVLVFHKCFYCFPINFLYMKFEGVTNKIGRQTKDKVMRRHIHMTNQMVRRKHMEIRDQNTQTTIHKIQVQN